MLVQEGVLLLPSRAQRDLGLPALIFERLSFGLTPHELLFVTRELGVNSIDLGFVGLEELVALVSGHVPVCLLLAPEEVGDLLNCVHLLCQHHLRLHKVLESVVRLGTKVSKNVQLARENRCVHTECALVPPLDQLQVDRPVLVPQGPAVVTEASRVHRVRRTPWHALQAGERHVLSGDASNESRLLPLLAVRDDLVGGDELHGSLGYYN